MDPSSMSVADIKDGFTICRLPKDVQIYCCQFLHEDDLYKLELVCKCLHDVSRDPNSIYHLSMYKKQNKNYYLNERYSRIQSLKIMAVDSPFIFNKGWGKTLKYLDITYYSFDIDKYVISAIIGCINLEKLSLDPGKGTVHYVSFDELQINDKLIVFPKLKYLQLSAAMDKLSNFIHLFLNNNITQKALHFSINSKFIRNKEITLFHANSKFALSAFRWIKKIKLYVNLCRYTILSIHSLLQNISSCFMKTNNKKIDFFELFLDFSRDGQAVNLVEMFSLLHQSIISYCKRSVLALYFNDDFNDYDSVNQEINYFILDVVYKSKCRTFQELRITFFFCFLLADDIYDELDPDQNNILNQNDLYRKGEEFAMKVINVYNKYIKPWLIIRKNVMCQIGMECIRIDILINYAISCMEPFDVVEKTWINTVYPVFEKIIKQQCDDDMCQIDINCDETNITFIVKVDE